MSLLAPTRPPSPPSTLPMKPPIAVPITGNTAVPMTAPRAAPPTLATPPAALQTTRSVASSLEIFPRLHSITACPDSMMTNAAAMGPTPLMVLFATSLAVLFATAVPTEVATSVTVEAHMQGAFGTHKSRAANLPSESLQMSAETGIRAMLSPINSKNQHNITLYWNIPIFIDFT